MNIAGKSEYSRLFVCDPVCVFPYGHNVPAMRNFRDHLKIYFDSVICIGNRLLPSVISEENNIEAGFEYLYNDVMPLPESYDAEGLSNEFTAKAEIAKRDILAVLEKYKINGAHDVLCFPSIDFYALHALAEASEALIAAGRPKLLIRLIGVMEHAPRDIFARSENVLFALISRLREAGLPVQLAAETPRYAEFLAINLNCTVAVCANIETREQQPFHETGTFNVICPGSARYDKGFLDLLEVFKKVRSLDRDLKIRFQSQVLPDRELKRQQNYLTQLYAVPGVTLLPSQISSAEMETMFDQADLIMLPYAADVYEFRGSAVFVEAICSGRQVVALDGPAFADQIRYFGAGAVSGNLTELADAVFQSSRVPSAVRYARARQARDRFVRDLNNSYRDWVA